MARRNSRRERPVAVAVRWRPSFCKVESAARGIAAAAVRTDTAFAVRIRAAKATTPVRASTESAIRIAAAVTTSPVRAGPAPVAVGVRRAVTAAAVGAGSLLAIRVGAAVFAPAVRAGAVTVAVRIGAAPAALAVGARSVAGAIRIGAAPGSCVQRVGGQSHREHPRTSCYEDLPHSSLHETPRDAERSGLRHHPSCGPPSGAFGRQGSLAELKAPTGSSS